MTKQVKQTAQQRTAEFKAIFEAVPGDKQIDKIRFVCKVLGYAENTVRIFLMKTPTRAIPSRMLDILRRSLEEQGANTA